MSFIGLLSLKGEERMKENSMVKAALRKMKVKDVNKLENNDRRPSRAIHSSREDIKNNQEKGTTNQQLPKIKRTVLVTW